MPHLKESVVDQVVECPTSDHIRRQHGRLFATLCHASFRVVPGSEEGFLVSYEAPLGAGIIIVSTHVAPHQHQHCWRCVDEVEIIFLFIKMTRNPSSMFTDYRTC